MQNVLPVVRISLVTISAVELASVLTRLRHGEARREAVWMCLLLAAFCARLLVPRGTIGDILIPIAVLACTADLLLVVNQRRGVLSGTLAAAGVAALLFAVDRFGPALPHRDILHASVLALLSLPPMALLVALQRKTGDPADTVLVALSAAWDAACCMETAGLVPAGASDWLMAPVLLLVGYMLFEQGYLSPLTTSGYVDRLALQRKLMRQTYARLLDSRHALVLQDRLIAAGLLALGAAHEFKDVLAAVKATAEHGRSVSTPAEKDACLELVAEHAASGGSSAVEFLERLGREGREDACSLDARELVERLVRVARPAWRPAGICLVVQVEAGVRLHGRRREIEQILLNLLRNAVDAFAGGPASPREITVCCRLNGRSISLDVKDNAGGLSPDKAAGMFVLGCSGMGSTGIGLYLARNLASRNGGSLSYVPVPNGSCFTLTLPGVVSMISSPYP
jgi:signal transduction histidine kinase